MGTGDSERDLLIAELRSLRKGRGITLTRLRTCERLLKVLDTDDPAQAQERLVDALWELGGDMPARALRQAYAVDIDPAHTLTRRRADFAVMNGDRHPDTIENYENDAIDELATRLVASGPPISVEPNVLAVEAYVVDGRLMSMREGLLNTDRKVIISDKPRHRPRMEGRSVDCLIHLMEGPSVDALVMSAHFYGLPRPSEVVTQYSPDLFSLLTFQGKQVPMDLSVDAAAVALPASDTGIERPADVVASTTWEQAKNGRYYSLHWWF